jgi:hypothetical protein
MKKTKRKHPRIEYHSKVDLLFSEPTRNLSSCFTKNLCLSGLWLSNCQNDCKSGEQCHVSFHDAGVVRSRTLLIKAQIARVEEDGIALIFEDMNFRTYTNLQTMMQNYTEKTYQDADDFLEEMPETILTDKL